MAFDYKITGGVVIVLLFSSLSNGLTYPNPSRGSISDNYFGNNVTDPYRWMEITESVATKAFVTAQNELSKPYFEKCGFRDQIRERLEAVWNYRKSDPPQKHGNHYFQYANNGLQNQNVLYIQDALEGPNINRRVFLDPNTLSVDGTVALTSTQSFSKDGEVFAYGLSTNGSDWRKVYFRNVSSNQDIGEVLTKVKFTDIVWKDNEGIFYGHYPHFEGDPEGSATDTNENQIISYHKLGTPQSDDVVIVEFPEKPKLLIASMAITSESTHLIVTPSAGDDEGSYGDNTIYYVDLTQTKWERTPVVDTFKAVYRFIADVNDTFYFLTNLDAPNYKVVGHNLSTRDPNDAWTTLVEEDTANVLDWATAVNGEYILLNYLEDVKSKLVLRSLISGNSFEKPLELEMGSIKAISGGIKDTQLFIKFESFLVPNRIYKLDFVTPAADIQLEILEDVEIDGFDPSLYTISQIKYESTNGTKVPMFIYHRKDLQLNGNSPAMLYGYGGFNINVYPSFSVRPIVFMDSFNGVAAIANIRGGGEYGNAWHEGGSLLKKQNVFDDFQAAAEYLIARNYTSARKMIIEGRSNGGLLVGACVNQRPELYGAAIASVGVMDMLRYHLFTIGHSWVSEYGSSADAINFENIYKYSPLHNIKFPTGAGNQYPAVLVTTSDHDDRVVPSHSYKYTAELQHTIGRQESQTQPLLLRVETGAGHGAGSPISKLIEEQVDILSFLTESLDLEFEGQSSDANIIPHSFVTITITFCLSRFFVSHS